MDGIIVTEAAAVVRGTGPSDANMLPYMKSEKVL